MNMPICVQYKYDLRKLGMRLALLAYTAHTVANCQRTMRIRQQFDSVHCACGRKSRFFLFFVSVYCAMCACWRQQFASAHCAYSNILLAITAHTVAICQRTMRIRQQIPSVSCACGSKNKMTRIEPICKKMYIFISALKSPACRDFMISKSLESKRSKSHSWAVGTFKQAQKQKYAQAETQKSTYNERMRWWGRSLC